MTRDDLEQLDTKALRALAQERLAARARSLRTRASLLAALTRALPPAVTPAVPRPASLPKAGRATTTRGAAVGQPPTSASEKPGASAAATTVKQGLRLPRPEAPAEESPVEEGFFLAPHAPLPARRAAPRAEAPAVRPSAVAADARQPPEDDVPHLLARDPTTLFLFWDFRRDLERGAAFGLSAPRVLFRLYDGEALVRSVEAPLGRRSLYLEGLLPGHLYSVEAWLAGKDGHARPTGWRSAPVRLAPAVPSARMDVQLLRVPPEQTLAEGRPLAEAAAPAAEALGAPARLDLPASLDWRGGPGPVPGSGRP
jgi:Domain of unknown function (DUF4912)